MTTPANSFKHDLIGHYNSQTDAEKDQAKAQSADPTKTYKVRYSWKQGVWVVAVLINGSVVGYLHPILD